MADGKRTCYVAMGFGRKTDFETGRSLDLDNTYRVMIKPAVEEAGLQCIRADEILHSGVINAPIYECLLESDVVIADLSTRNLNAVYELGIRHALRPRSTIVIAENQLRVPFDIGQIRVLQYHHLGEGIDADEVTRFRRELRQAILSALSEGIVDSPVYTYLRLTPPQRLVDPLLAPGGTPPPGETSQSETYGTLMAVVDEAINTGHFNDAKSLLHTLAQQRNGGAQQPDVQIIRRLAFATFRSKEPDEVQALKDAREILTPLNAQASNDTDILVIWAEVHSRLWRLTRDPAHLDEALKTLKRTFDLRNDHRSGIEYAFLLNDRAAHATRIPDAIADYMLARRAREQVLSICYRWIANNPELSLKPSSTVTQDAQPRYEMLATLAEAKVGLEQEDAQTAIEAANGRAPNPSSETQTRLRIGQLREWLAASPLKHLRAS